MRASSRALGIVVCATALASSGCGSKLGAEGASCEKQADCAEGLDCVEGKCAPSKAEAEAEPSPYCQTIAGLIGEWRFDTTVVGAETLASRGINGHYQLTVTGEGCEAAVALTKTGHDDVVYPEKKIQRSEAPISESQRIPGAAEVTVSLKGKPTHTLTFVVRDGALFGYWQSVGSDWERAGMWGFLRGVEAGQDLAKVEDFTVQPCEVACLTQCDATRRQTDQTLDEPGLSACMTACGAGEKLVGCGAGEAVPDALKLAVHGPEKTLDGLCGKVQAEVLAAGGKTGRVEVQCEQKPLVKDKPSLRALSKKQLSGGFNGAQLLQVGYVDESYNGRLILALETDAGWFWTDPLADLSNSVAGGVTVQTRSLVLRGRELVAAPGREVVAELTVATTDVDMAINEVAVDETSKVAVCSTGSPPTCVIATLEWSSERTLIDDKIDNDPAKHPNLKASRGQLFLAFVPEGRLSISAPADARPEERELAGIYAWPE